MIEAVGILDRIHWRHGATILEMIPGAESMREIGLILGQSKTLAKILPTG
jgi:hypothetical protein